MANKFNRKEATKPDGEVDRLCQLFKGRLNRSVAGELIEEYGGLQKAARFLMLGSTEKVRERLEKNEEYVKDLQKDAEKFRETLESGPEDMQFACESCNRMWWRRVPRRKQVSKCYRCRIKYDPIPREHQWGYGEFKCPMGHRFRGFGIMGRTKSKCNRCNMSTDADVMFIIPPKKRDEDMERPRRHRHNCNGVNCYSPAGQYSNEDGKPPVCIHPHSKAPRQQVRIHWASHIHASTGSTFVTVFDQGSLDSRSHKPACSLKTISEKSYKDN